MELQTLMATALTSMTILGVLGGFFLWLRPLVRQVREFSEDWKGEPGRPGVPCRPGMMQRLESVEADLKRVKYEVTPNGGGSAHDALMDAIQESDRKPTIGSAT